MVPNQNSKSTAEELPHLRKGIRKRKLPSQFHEMWASFPGIGGVMFRRDDDDFQVEWVTFVDGKKSPPQFVRFNALNTDPDMAITFA